MTVAFLLIPLLALAIGTLVFAYLWRITPERTSGEGRSAPVPGHEMS